MLTTSTILVVCVYTNKAQLEEWAERSNNDILDIKKHGYTKVLESKFLHSFYNSFDTQNMLQRMW